MMRPSFGSTKPAETRKRRRRRSRAPRQRPGFELLEDRCLLTTYTTPTSFGPVIEMVYGPVGDIWFSRLQDLSITRIAGDGTLSEYGLPPTRAQPVNLEVDAADNLWCTSAASPPANHLFRITPAGVVTEISDFTTVLMYASQTYAVSFLTHGHLNADNSGLLVGINPDGTTSFSQLPTGLPVGAGLYGGRPLSVTPDNTGIFWYTDNNALVGYTNNGEFERFPLPDSNDVAASVALGGDGNVWFVENSLHVSPTLDT
jgi:streptogramin lyase